MKLLNITKVCEHERATIEYTHPCFNCGCDMIGEISFYKQDIKKLFEKQQMDYEINWLCESEYDEECNTLNKWTLLQLNELNKQDKQTLQEWINKEQQ